MPASSTIFWQAKIWGLLHDSPLKPLQRSKKGDGPWNDLTAMNSWKQFTKSSTGQFTWIKQADLIASASDRAAIGSLPNWSHINYENGLEIRHLLSGKDLKFELPARSQLHNWRELTGDQGIGEERKRINQVILDTIPEQIRQSDDHQKVFWWLWRYLPEALSQNSELTTPNLLLIPAETRIPDCSIWSHNSMVAALAGSLMGYDSSCNSRPYVVTFTFTPVQEVVKASRKMQDFWAGSWILHYLSACICWAWAEEYGPDSLVYPSLFAQPLIDYWLLTQKYPEWQQEKLVNLPSTRQLLTAGFPNVLIIVLPENKVKSATDIARRLLTGESSEILSPWMNLANQVKRNIFGDDPISSSVWEEWLKAQWQIYWTALPLGDKEQDLARPTVEKYKIWQDKQNEFSSLFTDEQIFTSAEGDFVKRKFDKLSRNTVVEKYLNVNVGSWWAPIFDQTRTNLNAIKNARVWSLSTAFGSRSTISGIGAVVRKEAINDWSKADDLEKFWSRQRGLFDGREQLNATEVVKRGLSKVLHNLFQSSSEDEIVSSYPDLTAGVAGYIKIHRNTGKNHFDNFQEACQAIIDKYEWAEQVIREMRGKWGIPWMDTRPRKYHPRLLNAGWLVEDIETDEMNQLQQQLKDEPDLNIDEEIKQEIASQKKACKQDIEAILSHYYPQNNPTDWYILAAGDGDDMGGWLKGTKMGSYRKYVPSSLLGREPSTTEEKEAFEKFLDQRKRMGPATHAALSRALLDFSNQLVPYLTEERYAGRLIYSGGDDVLAYTNLWEWDNWLWDIRQCFKGTGDPEQERIQKGYPNTTDPHGYFKSEGDYWSWQGNHEFSTKRPLFTMGQNASISFGIVIAHHSVPLAIALENLWEAEEEAKEHEHLSGCRLKDRKHCFSKKDAVQVRVLYGNGNILKATSKFDVFDQWKTLLSFKQTHPQVDFDPALFEQVAEVWRQHPVPFLENSSDPFAAIAPWATAFCERRDLFKGNERAKEQAKKDFQTALAAYLKAICLTTQENDRDRQIQNWLKLAAFVLRKRDIQIGGVQ